nr:bifunctional indole-3-glycerol phosphate synthase/phosphoribosylanthranilate isomerase [Treponemataceae bacterium]
VGGTGKRIDSELVSEVQKKHKLWLAGGISSDNIAQVKEEYSPEMVDLSSSLEAEPGKKDFAKLENFFASLG